MTTPLRVYIASPYSADTEEGVQANIIRAARAACHVIHAGHHPVTPHAMTNRIDAQHFQEYGRDVPYDYWIAWCLAELETCDVLLYLDASPGVLVECAYAKECGIPVVDCVEELIGIEPRKVVA